MLLLYFFMPKVHSIFSFTYSNGFYSTKQRNEHGERCLFKFSYKKLPTTNANNCIAHKLNVEMAPLSLTFIPGLVDRLKLFFSVHGFYFFLKHCFWNFVFDTYSKTISWSFKTRVQFVLSLFFQIRSHLLVTSVKIFICITS